MKHKLLVEFEDRSMVGLNIEDKTFFVREPSAKMVDSAIEFLTAVRLGMSAHRLRMERLEIEAVARAWDDSIQGYKRGERCTSES